jgi:hypothetical protein
MCDCKKISLAEVVGVTVVNGIRELLGGCDETIALVEVWHFLFFLC